MRPFPLIKKIKPMLATLIAGPFDRKGWLFEVKWDGYRALAFKDKKVELLSRGQKSFNQRYPAIVSEIKKIPGDVILDGEIVVLDKKGRSNFQLLQNYQKKQEGALYYYVFDILLYKGQDLRDSPLVERKKILKKLVRQPGLTQIRFSDDIHEKGKAFFRLAVKKGLEGIIAKKEDSSYQSRRSPDWLKIKTTLRQEVVIGGFTEPKGGRKRFGALLLGVYENKELVYVGHVGTGFDEKLLEDIYLQLRKIASSTSPFRNPPRPNSPVTWVKPKLVCEVSFAEWTTDGKMRQPTFKGMRIDKNAKEVMREKPKRLK
jgi:bifunctional non-homologous end joining protein LigD